MVVEGPTRNQKLNWEETMVGSPRHLLPGVGSIGIINKKGESLLKVHKGGTNRRREG